MSILTYRPQELATARKLTSDAKNDTDALTFDSRNKISSHGEAAKKVRERKDQLNIQALEAKVDSAAYFDGYDIDDLEY